MAKVEISYEFIQEAMQSEAVRKGLRAAGEPVASRAQSLGANEGIDPHIRTEEGTRPKGRPYFRIWADADQEFGNTNTARRRILGRAAEGQ